MSHPGGGNGGAGGGGRDEAAAHALGARMSSGLSFREVGDWFKTLGDDLGSVIGIPRSRSTRRSSPPRSRRNFGGLGGEGSVSAGSGTTPRLPSTSILSKRQQVRVGGPASRQAANHAADRQATCRRAGVQALRMPLAGRQAVQSSTRQAAVLPRPFPAPLCCLA
jgi:hypothetical protein